ncbi:bifunctional 3-oxoadipate enol-lactonase/4-carboxymuconolactone decarboxylase PcaDC [Agromyces albus]|uniref:bifunctional 3-oxoadipate enol-lactonase/4-carboxymuconolactone decarboxylase PcaDC n=1 Tax=Agromyces albus TaxID=205332 RepID=UPI002784127E|nr:alpha/beta fold hydrolase [Agromyces albus]MDQ0576524.1 3-oxoadipate enol-lactonase/4-carboxymuconolactone decarboxylase [Agromyces albus]
MTIPRLIGSVTRASPDATTSGLLVLLPSLGTTTAVWGGVVAHVSTALPELRILRVDLPGHGASPATREPFTIAELAEATLRLVDETGGGRFHVAGLSLGGTIALELAAGHPDRVLGLAAFCSGSRIGDAVAWGERAAQVRASGTASLVTGSAARWYAPGHLEAFPDGPGARGLAALVDVDDESYALCAEALGGFDRTASLSGIRLPALIAAGEHDLVTTSASMRAFAEALPDARFAEIAGAAHLAPLEQPVESAAALVDLIRGGGGAGLRVADTGGAGRAEARATGMAVRRAVLGDAHVDAANAAITPETAAFQDFITRYAWGEIWSREQLSRRERSIATLASLVTGGHEAEIRMHVRAALRNGLTSVEITEVMLHTALYAGLPAANAALGIAREVFAGLDANGSDTDHDQEEHGG